MVTEQCLYAWMDLETNGRMLKDKGSPYEVALIITNSDLTIVRKFTSLVRNPEDNAPMGSQIVYDMHKESGLLKDMLEVLEVSTLPRVEDIDHAISSILLQFKEEYDGDMVLCGSGVSHFDSRWIAKFFPKTWSELKGFDDETKPTIDIGVVRRFLHSFCGVPKSDLEDMPQGNHRALNDLEAFILQARLMKTLINMGSNKWFGEEK